MLATGIAEWLPHFVSPLSRIRGQWAIKESFANFAKQLSIKADGGINDILNLLTNLWVRKPGI